MNPRRRRHARIRRARREYDAAFERRWGRKIRVTTMRVAKERVAVIPQAELTELLERLPVDDAIRVLEEQMAARVLEALNEPRPKVPWDVVPFPPFIGEPMT